MDSNLKKEFQYYLDNQEELVEKYNGKYIVIKDCSVIGEYNDELSAINETKKEHAVGTFLVQFVSPGNTAYRQTFHSRVLFS